MTQAPPVSIFETPKELAGYAFLRLNSLPYWRRHGCSATEPDGYPYGATRGIFVKVVTRTRGNIPDDLLVILVTRVIVR